MSLSYSSRCAWRHLLQSQGLTLQEGDAASHAAMTGPMMTGSCLEELGFSSACCMCIQAAELRAAGEPEQALRFIRRIQEVQPGYARAHFAAGQLHAALQAWHHLDHAHEHNFTVPPIIYLCHAEGATMQVQISDTYPGHLPCCRTGRPQSRST